MKNNEGKKNFLSQLCNSLIDSDVSINNIDNESNNHAKSKLTPLDLILQNEDKDNSFDFFKEFDNIEIFSDFEEDQFESNNKQKNFEVSANKPIDIFKKNFPEKPQSTYKVPQANFSLHSQNSINSHNSRFSQHSQYSQNNFRIRPPQMPSSNTSSFYSNSVHSNSSFPMITLTPAIPMYSNQNMMAPQQQIIYYPQPQPQQFNNNYNMGVFNSSNIIPYNGYIPTYTVVPNPNPSINTFITPLSPNQHSIKSMKSPNLSHSSSSNPKAGNNSKTNQAGQAKEASSTHSNKSNKAVVPKLSEKSVNTLSFHSEEGKKDKSEIKKKSKSGGKLLDYLCTPKGCRYFQSYILKASPDIIDQMIKKLSTNFDIVMTNSYANYFFQKFITSCNQEQRRIILTNISSNFLFIASDNSGTHALQAMFEHISSPEEISIISNGIMGNFVQICKGLNSNHIVQKLLSHVPEANRPVINSLILKNVNSLIYDAHGICVIKKFLTESQSDAYYKEVWFSIKNDCLAIIQDLYGNYIIQLLLELGQNKEIVDSIITTVIENIKTLTMDKVSSNVVERCLEFGDEKLRMNMISQLFNSSQIILYLKNKFSKYVIKKAISCMPHSQIDSIIKDYETRWSEFDSKDQKKLNTLIEKMLLIKNC